MADDADDPSIPPADGTCLFFGKLPREIRDEVYQLAYTQPEDHTIFLKKGYSAMNLEYYCIEELGHATQHPTPSTFIVSKEWFSEAFPTFIKHNTFRCQSAEDITHFLHSPIIKTNIKSLAYTCSSRPPRYLIDGDNKGVKWDSDKFVTYDWRPQRVSTILNACPKLTHLELDVDFVAQFNWNVHDHSLGVHMTSRRAWPVYIGMVYDFNVQDLKDMRGLKEFKMRAISTPGARDRLHAYHRFVGELEEEIKREVMKSRGD